MITQRVNRSGVSHEFMYRLKTQFFFMKKKTALRFKFNNFGYMILLICCFHFLTVRGFEESNITYVDECRADCARHKDLLTCGKFRAVQWLHNLTVQKNEEILIKILLSQDIQYGPIRLVRLSSPVEDPALQDLPQFRGFGLYSKFLKFLRSSAEDMLTRRALVYSVQQSAGMRSLSSGPVILETDELDEIVTSGRGISETLEGRLGAKKKKKALSVVLPFLILLKVIKLKLLLIPILIGVHFIKKVLVVGALAFASILANLKYCKVPPMPPHPTAYSAWTTAAEAPIDFSAAIGHEEDGWNQKIDMGFGGAGMHDSVAAGSQRNPYRGYYQALKQQQFRNVM